MKKLLLGLFLCGIMANAQNSLLWKITGNGLKEPSYVFGTIHLTCDATLDANTIKALQQTKQLYLELDMDDPTLQTTMMKGMYMKDGMTMSKLATPEDFAAVDAYMTTKLGASAKVLENMKPVLVSTMMLPMLMQCPLKSVEEELMKITKQQNEEVFGLETIDEQLAVFDVIPYKVQMDELVKSVKNKFVNDKAELDEMYKVYATKDLAAMHALVNSSDNAITSKYQDPLLNNRNANWIPRIESIAKQQPTFFGVGAAHLGGPKGVLELLRKRGFTVVAVE